MLKEMNNNLNSFWNGHCECSENGNVFITNVNNFQILDYYCVSFNLKCAECTQEIALKYILTYNENTKDEVDKIIKGFVNIEDVSLKLDYISTIAKCADNHVYHVDANNKKYLYTKIEQPKVTKKNSKNNDYVIIARDNQYLFVSRQFEELTIGRI